MRNAVVNLRDFYPQIYTADLFCELPEEIVSAIKQSIRDNRAYNERRRVHRALRQRIFWRKKEKAPIPADISAAGVSSP